MLLCKKMGAGVKNVEEDSHNILMAKMPSTNE
jgi:hypothetical protein